MEFEKVGRTPSSLAAFDSHFSSCWRRVVSRYHAFTVVILFAQFTAGPAAGQFGDGSAPATTRSSRGVQPSASVELASKKVRWQVGVQITAGGACQNLLGTLPIPIEWPGQKVRIVDEDKSTAVSSMKYRVIDGGVKQMVVKIGRLRPGQKAHALATVEIDREQIALPEDPESLVLPKKLDRKLRKYLGPSPYIEVRHPEIRELAKELYDESLPMWNRIEKIYDHVRETVKYENGKLKGALAALREGTGDCEELTSLFIALCRSNGIPARTVWVPDHCYPEFYLEDEEGNGTWYPCQAAGDRDFGTMPDMRPILQKGDSFKVPEKKDRQRYVSEFLTGGTSKSAGGGRPRVRFVRKSLAAGSKL